MNSYNISSLTHDLLRKVIIRIDIEGATNLDLFVGNLKKNGIVDMFSTYRRLIDRNVSRSYQIDTNSAVVEEEMSGPVHVFRDDKPGSDKVELELALNSISLTMDCKENKNIDDYEALIKEILQSLLVFDKFIVVKRIGIRKISGTESESEEEIFKIFNIPLFAYIQNDAFYESHGLKILYGDYTNNLISRNYDTPINLTHKRMSRVLRNPMTGKRILQAILDIDGYVTEQNLRLNNSQKDIDKLRNLFSQVNELISSLFIESLTEEYLEAHGRI